MKITAITRYKHGELYGLLRRLGWTQRELSRRSGVGITIVYNILNLKQRPSAKQANAIQVAFAGAGEFLDVLSMWPESFKGLGKGSKKMETCDIPLERFLDYRETLLIPAPETTSDMDIAELGETLERAMETISDRESSALRGFYLEGRSMQELAAERGCSHENISLALQCGLNRMRHPSRLKTLEAFA